MSGKYFTAIGAAALMLALNGCAVGEFAENLEKKSVVGDGFVALSRISVSDPATGSITPEIKAQMDLVLLASDHFHMKSFVAQPEDQTPSALAKHMMTFFRAAAVSGLADILVHPLWPYSFEPVYADAVALISENELTESLRMAAENHIAMELNGSVIAKKAIADPANRDAYLRIMSAAKTAGCKFTFGSDSHNRSQFELMAETARFAVEAGITAADLSPFMMAE